MPGKMHTIYWLVCVLLALCSAAVAKSFDIKRDLKATYFINLDHMPTRRQHMEQHLEFVGIQGKRWRAIDYSQVVHGEFNQEYLKPQGIAATLFKKTLKEGNGTIGCYLSHVTALIHLGKELGPDDLGMVMEDDLAIPNDWATRLQRALDAAPPDWKMLKLSGWGSARNSDLVQSSSSSCKHPDFLPKDVDTTMWTPTPGWSLSNFVQGFKRMFNQAPESPESPDARQFNSVCTCGDDQNSDMSFFQMRGPFKESGIENWGSLGWGSKTYFYSGTGAYLVRGSGIKDIVSHLRSRPIRDIDAMFLTDVDTDKNSGKTQIYEACPHVFGLSIDARSGPGLHNHKAFDEVEAGLLIAKAGTTQKSETADTVSSQIDGDAGIMRRVPIRAHSKDIERVGVTKDGSFMFQSDEGAP